MHNCRLSLSRDGLEAATPIAGFHRRHIVGATSAPSGFAREETPDLTLIVRSAPTPVHSSMPSEQNEKKAPHRGAQFSFRCIEGMHLVPVHTTVCGGVHHTRLLAVIRQQPALAAVCHSQQQLAITSERFLPVHPGFAAVLR